MPQSLRIAVIGAGGIAKCHIKHLLHDPDVVIAAIVDPVPGKAAEVRAELNLPSSVVVGTTMGEAMATDPLCADICAPPYLHGPYARQALEGRCHAIVEKPPCGSLAEFDQLIALQVVHGRRLLPVLQNRLGTGPNQLRALIRAGIPGRFLHGSVETHWRRGASYYAAPWRGKHATELGGPLTGLAIHTMDLCMPFHPPVVSVQAHVDTLVHSIEVEDTGAALLRLAGGSWLVHTVTTHAQREHTRGLLVYEHLQVEFGNEPYNYADKPWRFTSADPAIQARIDACLSSLEELPTPEGLDQIWYRQARQWCEMLRGGETAGRDLASSRPAFELLTAIYAAAKTGQTVHLPITSTHHQYHRLAP